MIAEDAANIQNDEECQDDAEFSEAAATMAAAAHTFRDARNFLNNVKEARGYFPVVGLGAWKPPSETPPSSFGKGKGKVKGDKGKSRKGGKPQAPAGPCPNQ
eukprot:8541533-Heterocapsa_arctica.AAC.1